MLSNLYSAYRYLPFPIVFLTFNPLHPNVDTVSKSVILPDKKPFHDTVSFQMFNQTFSYIFVHRNNEHSK